MFCTIKILGIFILTMVLFSCTSQQKKNNQTTVTMPIPSIVTVERYHWKTPKYKTVKAYMLSNDLAYSWIRVQDSGKRDFFEKVRNEKNVVLSNTQVKKIETLFTTTVSDSLIIGADCFNPRHIIVYYNQKDELTAAILICHECSKMQFFPEAKEDLNIYTENFRHLFQELGLPVFDNPLQHQVYIDSLKFLKKN